MDEKLTGFSIDNAINVNKVMNEDSEPQKKEDTKERRVKAAEEQPSAPQRRVAAPEAKPATPKYNVVTKK